MDTPGLGFPPLYMVVSDMRVNAVLTWERELILSLSGGTARQPSRSGRLESFGCFEGVEFVASFASMSQAQFARTLGRLARWQSLGTRLCASAHAALWAIWEPADDGAPALCSDLVVIPEGSTEHRVLHLR
jgi:hypothetical protein